MEINSASISDMQTICTLLQGQFDEHGISFDAERLNKAVEEILIDEQWGSFLLAREQDRSVGLAAVSYTRTLEHGGKSAWLDELYVLPEKRGRGIGTALVEEVIARCRASGCAAIDLEVDQEHQDAERLYSRHGFKQLPRARWALRV